MVIKLSGMDRCGSVEAPASKSQCNRLFVLAALGESSTNISCVQLSNDLMAMVSSLEALGAEIKEQEKGVFSVSPIRDNPKGRAELYCGESGSCLRFLLPVAGALGREAVFHMEGRLPERPIDELRELLCSHGMNIKKQGNEIYCSGRLISGEYCMSGGCSSQYISALLMALPLLEGESCLKISGPVQSRPYISLTEETLRLAGIQFTENDSEYFIKGGQRTKFPVNIKAEGDYSSAAFFLCAGALSKKGIEVSNLSPESVQGDREIENILIRMGAKVARRGDRVFLSRGDLRGISLDASQIPDLVPAVAVLASLARGESRIINAGRLRLKESDRLKSTCAMLSTLGADIEEEPDGLVIKGKPSLRGGRADSFNDHRIAMAAALAACGCENEVEICGAEAADKSYPRFWDDFGNLKE